jgi:hypothetical protein
MDGGYDMVNIGKFVWDTTGLDDGEYTLRLTVKDGHGAMIQEESATFYVYNANAPLIDLLAPKEGRVLKGTVDIKWDAYDEDEGSILMIDLEYSTDNENWNTIVKDQANTGIYRWDTKSAPDGDCYIRVRAKDDKFEVLAESGRCRVDNSVNTKPTVTLTSPSTKDEEITGIYKIEWTTSDPENDALTVTLTYSSDKSAWTEVEGGVMISDSGSFNWDTSDIINGKYYLRIIANDGKLESDPATSKPFIINHGGYVPPEDDDDDDDDVEPPEEEEETGLSTGAMVGIVSLIVVLVLVAVIIIIVLVVVMRKKKKQEEAPPPVEPQAPAQSPTAAMYGTSTAYGAQPQYGQQQQMGAGQQPQQVGGQTAYNQYQLPPAQEQQQQ